MRVLGGLSIDYDSWDFLFVSLKRNKLTPYTGISGESDRHFDHLKEFVMNNIDYINERVSYIEKKNSFKVESIFFRLPREYACKKETEDVISLNLSNKVKRITYKDIDYVKKQIENISLSLKDTCVHHLVLEYRIEDKTFSRPPIGLWARKIHVKSVIIFIPSELHDVFMDSFSNVERKFSGFVYGALADYSAAYNNIIDKLVFVVNIKKNYTSLSCFRRGNIIFEKVYDFGNRLVISYVAKRLSLNEELVSDLIFKYGSFYDADLSKEISVREQNAYINISLATLNSLIREAITKNTNIIISDIKNKYLSDDYAVLFIGKIAQRDGFYDFAKKYFNMNIEYPLYNQFSSCAFGCVHYGITRLFERQQSRDSIWQRVVRFYRDYF